MRAAYFAARRVQRDFGLSAARGVSDAANMGFAVNFNPFRGQPVGHKAADFRVFAAQTIARLNHADRAAEPVESLRQFHAYRPAANDQQMLGLGGQVKHGFIGQIGGFVEATHRRQQGAGAGGNDKAFGVNGHITGGQCARAGKVAISLNHPHTKLGKTLNTVHWRNAVNHIAHMRHDFGKADPLMPATQAKRRDITIMGMGGGRQQCLGRHAAIIQAITAHFTAFDQHHISAHLRRPGCHRQAARAAANHANIGFERLTHIYCLRYCLPYCLSASPRLPHPIHRAN